VAEEVHVSGEIMGLQNVQVEAHQLTQSILMKTRTALVEQPKHQDMLLAKANLQMQRREEIVVLKEMVEVVEAGMVVSL